MKADKLYRIAKKRHGQLDKDVVHDMYCKFGQDLPGDAYLNICIQHAKPKPIVEMVEKKFLPLDSFYIDEVDYSDQDFDSSLSLLSVAVNNVRAKYELEVDTFLECHVNGDYKSFGDRSGIARSVLEKICKFVKYEILKEFFRIKELD